jgi:CRP/FNR family cyclic AMP-dependent transcriptional regulator
MSPSNRALGAEWTQHVCDQLASALPTAQPRTIRQLAERARVRTIERGEEIHHQGDEFPLTLMVSGFAAFRRTTVDGRELLLHVTESGEIFGLVSVASERTTGDLVALTDATVAVWPGTFARGLVAADPGFALDVIDRLARTLVSATERLDGYLYQDARRRVLRALARHRDLFFADTPILLRGHVASLVGTSRQMTGRVLRELEREGMLVRTGRDGLRLLSPEALDAAVAGDEAEGA